MKDYTLNVPKTRAHARAHITNYLGDISEPLTRKGLEEYIRKRGCIVPAKPNPDSKAERDYRTAKRVYRIHIGPLLSKTPQRLDFLGKIPLLLNRLAPKAITACSLYFHNSYNKGWHSLQDADLKRHLRETKIILDAEHLKLQIRLEGQFEDLWPKLKPHERNALPILIALANHRGTTEFDSQGFFYLSGRALSERMLIDRRQGHRILKSLSGPLKVIKLVRRGLSREESAFLTEKDGKAAAYRIMV